MAHDVFISYSKKDKPTADAACATLESRGIRCWIAPRDVSPGDEYAAALVNALRESRIVVLVFSATANYSQQVLRELERAVSHGLIIIPLRIEDVNPSAAMEYYISSRHWLDALNPPLERHLVMLADIVQRNLDRPGKPQFTQSDSMRAVKTVPSSPAPAVEDHDADSTLLSIAQHPESTAQSGDSAQLKPSPTPEPRREPHFPRDVEHYQSEMKTERPPPSPPAHPESVVGGPSQTIHENLAPFDEPFVAPAPTAVTPPAISLPSLSPGAEKPASSHVRSRVILGGMALLIVALAVVYSLKKPNPQPQPEAGPAPIGQPEANTPAGPPQVRQTPAPTGQPQPDNKVEEVTPTVNTESNKSSMTTAVQEGHTTSIQQPGMISPGTQQGQRQDQSQQPPPAAVQNQPATPSTGEQAGEDADCKKIKAMTDTNQIISNSNQFLERYPNARCSVQIYGHLASAYLQLGDGDKAGAAAQKALRLDPKNVDALPVMAVVSSRQITAGPGSAQMIQATENYARQGIQALDALQKPPDVPDVDFTTARNEKLADCHSAMGLAYLYENKGDLAVQELSTATKIVNPPDSMDLYLLGVAYDAIGQFGEAVTSLEAACPRLTGEMQQRCNDVLKRERKKAPGQPPTPSQ